MNTTMNIHDVASIRVSEVRQLGSGAGPMRRVTITTEEGDTVTITTFGAPSVTVDSPPEHRQPAETGPYGVDVGGAA